MTINATVGKTGGVTLAQVHDKNGLLPDALNVVHGSMKRTTIENAVRYVGNAKHWCRQYAGNLDDWANLPFVVLSGEAEFIRKGER